MAEHKKSKRKKRKRLKKQTVVTIWIVVLILIAVSVISVIKIKEKKVFTIGSEKVYTDELSFYALQCAYRYHLFNMDMLYEYYDGATTYEEQYKNEVRQNIVDTKVMYLCALQQGITLSQEDQGIIDAQVSEALSNIGEELENFNIKKSLVKRVLTEQYYAELLKQTVVTEEEQEQQTYFHTYNLLFPTVKTNADGTVEVNEDGTLVPEGETDKQKQYTLAMKAIELSKAGKSMEQIAEELGVTATSGDIYGNIATYDSEQYLEQINKMKEQSVSDIVETVYGYNVFYLYSKDDEAYAANVSEQADLFARSELLETQLEKWYQSAGVDAEQLQSNAWEKFTMKDYVLKR